MYQSTGAGATQSQGHEFDVGAPILDANGNKLGSLSELGVHNGYLVVHHGMLMGRDSFVPLSSIIGADANSIYLDLTKDDLSQMANQPPTTAPSGVAGTGDRGNTWSVSGDANPAGADQGPISQRPPLWIRPPRQLQATAASSATTQTAQQDEVRVPLREEELVAGTREQERGRVHLGKDVVEEQQQVNVPVTHEEVYVERVPVQGGSANLGPDAFQEKDIDVPVMGEEIVAEKRGGISEEVRLRKQAVTEEQQVSDTVRKERLNVRRMDDQGNVLDESGQPIGQFEDETSGAQP